MTECPPIKFTRFTRDDGAFAKVMSRGPDGKLKKEADADMCRGGFETMTLDTSSPGVAGRLADMLSGWKSNQALSPSLSLGEESGRVVTKAKLSLSPGAVARTKEYFGFMAGVGAVVFMDYDPREGTEAMPPSALWQALRTLWPAVDDGAVLHWVSGSSLIFHRGKQLSGIGGQRCYIPIRSHADVPRVVRVLNERAWLQGFGYIHIAKNGAMRARSLFDGVTGEPGRLDFAPAGAVCRAGLEQRRGPPEILADGEVLDSIQTLPDLTPGERVQLDALIESAKLRAKPEAEARKAAWMAEREGVAVADALKAGANVEQVQEVRQRVRETHEALLGGVLLSGAEVTVVDDAGAKHVVTVRQILSEPMAYHGKRCLSIHDPEHRNGSPDAIIYSAQATPIIYDLDDGGSKFRLQAQRVHLVDTGSNLAQLADQVATALAKRNDLFIVAGVPSIAVQGGFHQVGVDRLRVLIGETCAVHRQTKSKATPCNPSKELAQAAHTLLTTRWRHVQGRSSIALIDARGRIVRTPGLDDETGVFLDIEPDSMRMVPSHPTRAQTVAALQRLWSPLNLYEWETSHDRAAMLATLLTVPLRPLISAAPGLFCDASTQGAGKSSAVGVVMCLAQGHRGGMSAWVGANDEEINKHLLSLALKGANVAAYDNITGKFESTAIAAAVTEGQIEGRLLRTNTAQAVPFRVMWLASGNNASLSADSGVRFLQARIACPDGTPHRKSFPFEPSEAARADRHGIVHAILTVHRAFHTAGCPKISSDGTRFPEWDKVVRQCVLWLRREGIDVEAGIGELGDAADSILNHATDSDPESELSAVLFAELGEHFGIGDAFDASQVWKAVQAAQGSPGSIAAGVADAVMGFLTRPSRQSISFMLANRRDRVHGGLRLKALPRGEGRAAQRAPQKFVVLGV